ncbi:helix-turn-helix domain-containing protein [Methylobacterium sp. E-005]|uniref:helix-turn-helix domain-containing protein n=1 Tax=Methylobacterium sp. E-005 TaxID=2836549 RepID=UPI00391A2449
MIATLNFNSLLVNERRGFEAYHGLFSSSVDVDLIGENFKAVVHVLRTPRMIMYERHVSDVQHSRDITRVRRDNFDHFALHLLLSGEFLTGPIGSEQHLNPGEIMIVDTSRPHRSRMKNAHVISVQLAREHVRSVLRDVDHLHGTVLPARAAGLLSDFMSSVMRRVETLPAPGTGHAGRAITELLGLAVAGLPITSGALSHEAGEPIRRRRAEAFIAEHLTDARLDARAIAIGIGVSRSTLYSLFSEDGGIARYIQRRRLDAVRKVLLRPDEDRSLAALAYTYGFSNESHFSRLFAGAFGVPPGRFRADVRRMRLTGFGSGKPSDPHVTRWPAELY